MSSFMNHDFDIIFAAEALKYIGDLEGVFQGSVVELVEGGEASSSHVGIMLSRSLIRRVLCSALQDCSPFL